MSRSNIDDKNLSVETVMTPLPLDTANASDSALDLAKKMKEKGRGSVVVTEYSTATSGSEASNVPVGISAERYSEKSRRGIQKS